MQVGNEFYISAVTQSSPISNSDYYAFIGSFVKNILFFSWWALEHYFVIVSEKLKQQQRLSGILAADATCLKRQYGL